MAIAVRANGSVTYDKSGASSVTVTMPSGTQTGDLMVATASLGQSGSLNVTWSTPSGWTAIASNVGVAGTASGERTSVYYRVAAGGDTGGTTTWTFSLSGGSVDAGIALQSFSGVNTSSPIDNTGTTGTDTGATSVGAATFTVNNSNSWWILGCGDYSAGSNGDTDSGFTFLNNAAVDEYASLGYKGPISSTGATTISQGSGGGGSSGNSMSLISFTIAPAVTSGGGYFYYPKGGSRLDPVHLPIASQLGFVE
jgi:hypothetical protein